MKFNQIIAPSMKELFIKEIEALILSGQLKVGEKLPTERELADEMKISRTIVNLGLSELKNKGFIDIVPRKGAFVADYAKNGKLDTLISIINFNGGRFDKKTVNSIMEFRRINEGEGTYLAAKYRTDDDVKQLKSILEDVKNCDDRVEIAHKLFKFHHVILCASMLLKVFSSNSYLRFSAIATKRKYFSGLTIWLWQSSKRTAMAHAIKSKQFSKTVSKTSINTALTIRYIDSLSQNTHKLRLTGCNRNL